MRKLRKCKLAQILKAFLASGVAYLTCAHAFGNERPLVVPFVPGSPASLDWLQDLKTDRVFLESCEPLSELARSYKICETIYSTGEQKTIFVMGENVERTLMPRLGFVEPRASVRLHFRGQARDVEFVPIFPFLSREKTGGVLIGERGAQLNCDVSPVNMAAKVVSKKWTLRKKDHGISYEFEGNTIPLSVLVGQEKVLCRAIVFNGTLFHKLEAEEFAVRFLRGDSQSERDFHGENSPQSEEPLQPAPRMAAPSQIFVPPGSNTAWAQVELFLSLPTTRVQWICATNTPSISCHWEGAGLSRKLVISNSGKLVAGAAVTFEATFRDKEKSVSLKRSIPVSYDSAVLKMADAPVKLTQASEGHFTCSGGSAESVVQDVLWFWEGKHVETLRGRQSAIFSLPSTAHRVGCLLVTVENGFLAVGSAETVFMPKPPQTEDLPERILVMKGRDVRIAFAVSTHGGAPQVSCVVKSLRGFSRNFCEKDFSNRVEASQGFFINIPADFFRREFFRDSVLRVQMSMRHGTYFRDIPISQVSVAVKPRIHAVFATRSDSGVGECVFLVQDPQKSHFTVRAKWQDDPGRTQDFSTFLRDETKPLVAAHAFFGAPELRPLQLFVGITDFENVVGKPMCDVLASNGVLFAARVSQAAKSSENAQNQLLAAAHRVLEKPGDFSFDWNFSRAVSVASNFVVESSVRVAAFRAGETWELPVRASVLMGCVGHREICGNARLMRQKIVVENTITFSPGRAFIAFKNGASARTEFVAIEVLNTAYSPRFQSKPEPQDCGALVARLLSGDQRSNEELVMSVASGERISVASWFSLDSEKRGAVSCSVRAGP